MRRSSLPGWIACAILICVAPAAPPAAPTPRPAPTQSKEELVSPPHVDERVELLSIVFRLAGNPEYNMNRLPAYNKDIDTYFAPFTKLPAIQLAADLRKRRGIAYDAVMAMAVHISPPPAFEPLVPFTSGVPEPRWDPEDSSRFLKALRDFYKVTRFQRFYQAHEELYREAETRYAAGLAGFDPQWLARFYGVVPHGRYVILIGMNNGSGFYGPSVAYPDGRVDRYAILGAAGSPGDRVPAFAPEILPLLVHEFSHSFVNPAVKSAYRSYAGADRVFASAAQQMQRRAYANSQVMVDESLVRAGVILYLEAHGATAAEVAKRIDYERSLGFAWIGDLVGLLRGYNQQRDRYPTLASFMPEVEKFFDNWHAGTAPAAVSPAKAESQPQG